MRFQFRRRRSRLSVFTFKCGSLSHAPAAAAVSLEPHQKLRATLIPRPFRCADLIQLKRQQGEYLVLMGCVHVPNSSPWFDLFVCSH